MQTSISRSSLQSTLNGISTNLWETTTTTGNGYTNVAWPTTNVIATLNISYYDGYTMPGVPSAFTAPAGANLSTRGELTGTQTNVLGTSNMLWTAHYYDNWGRSLEAYAQHYLGGVLSSNNYDAITSTYNFTNAPTTVARKHWTSATTSYPLVTIYNRYTYDWIGRKLYSYEQITNKNLTADTLRLLSLGQYNEIGQLVFKKLHSKDSVNYLQTVGYSYNERGWLTQAYAPLFAMTLYYNAGASKAYNGNIMYQYWGVPGNLSNHYTYTYDKLNRLMSGVTSADSYKENGIVYDTEGNLTFLNRYAAGAEIDQLHYYYNSKNSLDSVKDSNASNSGLVSGTTKYTYDGNGNMLTAANTVNTRQNKGFTYNLLNLPNVVTVPNGTDTYTYDAGGNKLRRVSVIGGVTNTTDYIGRIEYDNSTTAIGFIQTEEGKAVPNGTTNYDYNYYLGDDLGNTRVTFGTKTGAAAVYQQDDYYPFGMEINRTPFTPKNEYLYNKKELQEDFTEYDYGARFYDPVVVHWNTIDPMAEKNRRLSTYTYAANNPIRFIDVDGMAPGEYYDQKGKKRGQDENGVDGNVRIVTSSDELKTIDKNNSAKTYTQSTTIHSGVSTTKAALNEAETELKDTKASGGLHEQAAAVTPDGRVFKGTSDGDATTATDDGVLRTANVPLLTGTGNTSVHSHETALVTNKDGTTGSTSAEVPGPKDPGVFANFSLNIIVGNLGYISVNNGHPVTPTKGAAFFDSNSQPLLEISQNALENILK